jgi:DNA replication protein DnaC
MTEVLVENGEIMGTGKHCECGRELNKGYLSFLQKFINIECECIREKRNEQDKLHSEFEKQADIQKLFSVSGLTDKQKEMTLDNFNVTAETARAANSIKKYIENANIYLPQGKGIYLMGGTGSGKTHLACAVAIELIKKGISVAFESVSDLFTRIRYCYNNGIENEREILHKSYNSKVLILDDLGAEISNEKVQKRFHNIIDFRLRHRLATIITSNIKPEELQGILDPRTIDRITDKFEVPFVVLTLNCESYRQSKVKTYIASHH